METGPCEDILLLFPELANHRSSALSSLALLFAFSTSPPNFSFVNAGTISKRAATFFKNGGVLTNYARGVLIANASWTTGKILVLLISWCVIF